MMIKRHAIIVSLFLLLLRKTIQPFFAIVQLEGLKKICTIFFFFTCISCNSQPPFGADHLLPEKTIALPGVKGRIDHMAVNLKDQIIYMAALGNNSLEIINLANGVIIHSIRNLNEPQGVAYIPQHNEIFIANGGDGVCSFYSAKDFKKITVINLPSDADDVRYDSANKKIYVGYGNGGIAIIDVDTHKQVGDIKLPAHPEGFQIDRSLNRLYVNLPDADKIGVADLGNQQLITLWNNIGKANFPMTIDTANHYVFVGYRNPPKLAVINERTGKAVSIVAMVGDADDLYYDENSKQIFVSGGGGAVQLFRKEGNGYKQVTSMATRTGGRTSLLIPQLKLFVLAEQATRNKKAELLVYKIGKS